MWRTAAHSNKTQSQQCILNPCSLQTWQAGQLVLLNKQSSIKQSCFHGWCGSSLFYFLIFLLPADRFCLLFFFSIGFSTWALIPMCLCCVRNWRLFFSFYPLATYLCFFSAAHWRSVKHRANSVPQNYFSFTVQTIPPHCCLGLILHTSTSAQLLLKGSISCWHPQSLVPSLVQPLSLIWLHC